MEVNVNLTLLNILKPKVEGQTLEILVDWPWKPQPYNMPAIGHSTGKCKTEMAYQY